MSSRTIRLGAVAGRRDRPLPIVTAVLVFVGLAVSALVNIWIEPLDAGALPGVALGSQTVLVVERFLAFFAAWLLVLVVSAQALKGRLPIEISGRGLRYAEAERSQDGLVTIQQALSRLDDETEALRLQLEGLTTED